VLRIVTHAYLAYSVEQVWSVLSDLRRYAEWNPLNVAADGEAQTSAQVAMAFVDPGHPGRVLRQLVRITAADPPRKLEWLGRIPVLFSGRHFFELTPTATGTDFEHGEIIWGLVPALWSSKRIELQRRAYEHFNEALARRLEHIFEKKSWLGSNVVLDEPSPH
jgi:hypothetical protein